MRLALVVILLLISGDAAFAAAPVVDFIYPAGGQRGTSVNVSVGQAKSEGKLDGWPARMLSDRAGLKIEAGKENGTFTIHIADDAPAGPHLLRVVNSEGSSTPRVFHVGTAAEDLEDDKASKDTAGPVAQNVARLPAVLNGRLSKNGESDAWTVEVTQPGAVLVGELTCKRLGSPSDPLLQLMDAEGTVLAESHDTFGLDPLLAYEVTKPGRYTFVVAGFANPPDASVRFAGSKATVYRLAVTTGPYVRYSVPTIAPRGKKSDVRLFGWNLPGGEKGTAATIEPGDADDAIPAGVAFGNPFRIPLADVEGTAEAEPNDSPDAAQLLPLPAAIDGELSRKGDVDCYRAAMKKGEKLTATVIAQAIASPMDAVVTVTGPDGSEAGRADDEAAGKPDPRVEWTAKAAGEYTISVRDLKGAGRPGAVYRLVVSPPVASVTATADAASYQMAPGKSVEVKVTVTRTNGHAAKLMLVAENLPTKVGAKSVEVPAKGGAVTLKLDADAKAKPADSIASLWLVEETDGKTIRRPVTFTLDAGLSPASTSGILVQVVAK